jgi:hypothetical protein
MALGGARKHFFFVTSVIEHSPAFFAVADWQAAC